MAKQKETAKASTAIAKPQAAAVSVRGELISVDDWALVSSPEALEATTYNLQGETLSEFDLDRVRVPAGGGTFFAVPVLGKSEPQPAESIRGIILSVSSRRAYWEDANPSGAPPDCSSVDGVQGIGTPGGSCAGCPFNEFGSAIKQDGSQGNGKRCRESRVILMLREEDRLPIAVIAPAGSLKNVKKYLMQLPVFMYAAVTELKLEKEKSTDGIAYSKIALRYIGHIDPETAKSVKAYAEAVKASINAKAPTGADASVYSAPSPVDDLSPANNESESSLAGFADDDDSPSGEE